LDYVFTKNIPKLSFLGQVPNSRIEKHFWIHITIESSGKLDWEDVEKNSKLSIVYYVDCVWRDKNLFWGPYKNPGTFTSQGHILMKNVQNGGYSLDLFFKASWLHAWKNLDDLELYNI